MHWSAALVTLVLLALVALAAATLWAHLRFWVARLTLALEYTEELTLTTEDGAQIELRRVPILAAAATGEARERAPELPPVLLVHGIGANHRNQDMHPDHSLARYLATLGRDVWLLTLRSGRRLRRSERRGVRFEAMVRYDLPRAIEAIAERTGWDRVDYVGFSMGGMLLYAALGRSVPEARVRRAVLVGSPGWVGSPTRLLRLLPQALLPGMPLRLLAQTFAFASEWMTTPIHHAMVNPRNVPPGLTRLMLMNGIADIPGSLNGDFLAWAAGDGEIRVGGARALDGLAGVRTPALFLAGSADRIAPLGSVQRAFEAWGRDQPGIEKRLLVLGRDAGASADYGHGDLTMGPQATKEIFEPIGVFLGEDNEAAAADSA